MDIPKKYIRASFKKFTTKDGIVYYSSDNFYYGIRMQFCENRKEPKEYDYYVAIKDMGKRSVYTPMKFYLTRLDEDVCILGRPRRKLVWLLRKDDGCINLYEIPDYDSEIFNPLFDKFEKYLNYEDKDTII